MKCLAVITALALTACGHGVETHPYYAIDGDTISVGAGPHIRLLYIDAPELPGHCRPGRHCVAGDPYAAKDYLQSLLGRGDMVCSDREHDVYGRRLADCNIYITTDSGGTRSLNLSQAMLDSRLVGLYHRS